MAKESNALVLAYRRVFSSEEGKLVLDDICCRGKLLGICETPEDIGRENLAKEIVVMAYSNDEGYVVRNKFVELLKRLVKLRDKK